MGASSLTSADVCSGIQSIYTSVMILQPKAVVGILIPPHVSAVSCRTLVTVAPVRRGQAALFFLLFLLPSEQWATCGPLFLYAAPMGCHYLFVIGYCISTVILIVVLMFLVQERKGG